MSADMVTATNTHRCHIRLKFEIFLWAPVLFWRGPLLSAQHRSVIQVQVHDHILIKLDMRICICSCTRVFVL